MVRGRPLNVGICKRLSLAVDVFDEEAGELESEDGGGVGKGAVDGGFAWRPGVGRVGGGGGLGAVGQALGRVDAEEFASWPQVAALEVGPQGTGQGTARDFVEGRD